MDTLDRYIIRETTAFLILILLGLAFLFLGIDFLSNFWRSPHPVSRVALTYMYRIPSAIQQFVPVACLMATLLVLTGLSRQNEILALYSSGISSLRILSTFVALVAMVSTVSFLVLDPIMPVFTRKQILVSKGLDPSSTKNLSSFNRTKFWYRSGRSVYNFGRFLPKENKLQDVRIYDFSPSFYMQRRIHAKQAIFDGQEWELQDGLEVTYPRDIRYPVAHTFQTKKGLIAAKPSDFQTLEVRADTMRLKELRHYINRNQEYGLDTTSEQVNYHERIALVFTPLVLVLLGIPFAINPLKSHSAARSVTYCFGLVLAYLVMSRLTLSVGKSGLFSPFIAAWSPNFLFLGVASFRLWRN